MIWTNLNEDNKVSLFVRFINLETKEEETRIINKTRNNFKRVAQVTLALLL